MNNLAPKLTAQEYANVFQRYHEAETKYGYFVLGVTLAILAFSVQYLPIVRIPETKWVLISSWICFLLSFICGFLRADLAVYVRMMDVDLVESLPHQPPVDWIKRRDKTISRGKWFYRFQKYLLLTGLLFYSLFHILNFIHS